jgi:hypothetical protein
MNASATIRLYDPTGVPPSTPASAVQTIGTLAGKVVGFIDNSKPNFAYLVDDLAELLRTKYGVREVLKHRKRAASVPAGREVIEDFTRRCDLVIAGSGD